MTAGCTLLAFFVLLLTATGAADTPSAGGQYWYHQPRARLGTGGYVRVSVQSGGRRAYVSWKLMGRAGCKFHLNGKSVEYFSAVGGVSRSGATGIRATVKADGTFSGALHKAPRSATSKYIKHYLAKTRGRFVSGGQAAIVKVRLKYLDKRSAKYYYKCDGRWLTFRANLEKGPQRPRG